MRNLNDDIKYASAGKDMDMFGFIYSRTNENVFDLFNAVDVSGKDVYTVLSSADFLFSALNGNAGKVDAFDINPLTYRYFHLRKWLLQYGIIDADGLSIDNLLTVVNRHLPPISKDEEESAIFWRDYLSKINTRHFYSDALFSYTERPIVSYADNMCEVVKRLNSREIVFDSMDICQAVDIDRKYDVIFTSNILDYNRKPVKLKIAADNLYRFLRSDGKIVCSHMNHFGTLAVERDAFSNYFTYNELFTSKSNGRDITYYQYIKKQ